MSSWDKIGVDVVVSVAAADSAVLVTSLAELIVPAVLRGATVGRSGQSGFSGALEDAKA